jgi:hypothetical protein
MTVAVVRYCLAPPWDWFSVGDRKPGGYCAHYRRSPAAQPHTLFLLATFLKRSLFTISGYFLTYVGERVADLRQQVCSTCTA